MIQDDRCPPLPQPSALTLARGLPPAGRPLAEAIVTAATAYRLDPFLLAAICARESGFGALLSKNQTGDYGHGRGLMQIDDRTHAPWLATAHWKEPAVNLAKGAEILRAGIDAFANLPGVLPLSAGIAAYNAGPGAVLRALKRGAHPDTVTTGKNYSADVLKRMTEFKRKALA